MTRRQKFERRYGIHASDVLISIARVAAAGRSRNQSRIAAERARHYAFMATLTP